MAQVLDRQELQTDSGTDTKSPPMHETTRIPTADEVRALVEGPPPRRQIRWLRWLGVFAALLVAGGVTVLVMRDDGIETIGAEMVAGEQWFMPASSPDVAVLPVEQQLNLPDNAHLMVTTTPHGVSYDWVVITPTPHGASIDAFVPAPLVGNPTQLPEGVSPTGTVYENVVVETAPLVGNPTQLPEGTSPTGTVYGDGLVEQVEDGS